MIFRACAACEKDIRWDEFNHALTSNHKECWDAVVSIMGGILDATRADKLAIALSGGDNFRKRLADTYKRHRTRKPLNYTAIRERLEETYPCKSVETLEGDDLLGIWQTSGKFGDTIIWSDDKDMKGIPGKHWTKDGYLEVSEAEADYFWMTQVLTGDATDGYSGLPGVGPKGAEKILPKGIPLEVLWECVTEAYGLKGLEIDDALLQARLARILRATDWDSEKKEVILWRP